MINLKEHIIFVESLNMEVVPYSVAKAALEEVSNPKTDKYFNKLDNVIINQTKRIKSNQHDLYLVMRSINKVNAQLHDNKNELEKIKQYIDKRCDNIIVENNELDIYIKNKFKKVVKKIKHVECKNKKEQLNSIVSVDNENYADDEHTQTE